MTPEQLLVNIPAINGKESNFDTISISRIPVPFEKQI